MTPSSSSRRVWRSLARVAQGRGAGSGRVGPDGVVPPRDDVAGPARPAGRRQHPDGLRPPLLRHSQPRVLGRGDGPARLDAREDGRPGVPAREAALQGHVILVPAGLEPRPDQVPQGRVGQVGGRQGQADPGQRRLVGEDEVDRFVPRTELPLEAVERAEAVERLHGLAELVEEALERGPLRRAAARVGQRGTREGDEGGPLLTERQAGARDEELGHGPEPVGEATHDVQGPAGDGAAGRVHGQPRRHAVDRHVGVHGQPDHRVGVEGLVDATQREAHLRQALVGDPQLRDGADLREQPARHLGQASLSIGDPVLRGTVEGGAHALPRLALELQTGQVDDRLLGDEHVAPAVPPSPVRDLLRDREEAHLEAVRLLLVDERLEHGSARVRVGRDRVAQSDGGASVHLEGDVAERVHRRGRGG